MGLSVGPSVGPSSSFSAISTCLLAPRGQYWLLLLSLLTFVSGLIVVLLFLPCSHSAATTDGEKLLSEIGVEPAIDERVVADGRHGQPMANEEDRRIVTRGRVLQAKREKGKQDLAAIIKAQIRISNCLHLEID